MREGIIFDLRYQAARMEVNDSGHIQASLDGAGEMAFEEVFKSHFKSLHSYAYTIVKDDIMAEEMVQNVFCKLWEKTGKIQIQQSITAYLYKAVYHESINYLRHEKVKAAHQSYTKHHSNQTTENTSKKVMMRDLEERLAKALQDLPEKCRTVFQMSRFDELKYQEIADRLNISIKTVENQMGKALRLLRLNLIDFLPALLLLLLNM